jgi:hypothetical protein
MFASAPADAASKRLHQFQMVCDAWAVVDPTIEMAASFWLIKSLAMSALTVASPAVTLAAVEIVFVTTVWA